MITKQTYRGIVRVGVLIPTVLCSDRSYGRSLHWATLSETVTVSDGRYKAAHTPLLPDCPN